MRVLRFRQVGLRYGLFLCVRTLNKSYNHHDLTQ